MKSWLIPLIQSAFIILLVLSYYAIEWVGTEYTLRTEPYDPYNPVYGEYVMLQYPDLKIPDSIQEGTIYFTLKKDADGYASVDRIQSTWFFGAIKGEYYSHQLNTPQLSQFYVEQGKGKELEQTTELKSVIYVAPWGSIKPISLEKR